MKFPQNLYFLTKLQFDAMIKGDIMHRFLVDLTESHHGNLYRYYNGLDLRLADHETCRRHIGRSGY